MTPGHPAADIAALEKKRDRSLGLDPPPMLRTGAQAEHFLARVGIALRYGAGSGLPLASMYHAAAGAERDNARLIHAIEVTNHALETRCGIEVSVIADRLTLVHRSVMPALYALVRRGQDAGDLSGLTLNGQATLRLIRERKEITVGGLRKWLGLTAGPKHDPAYEVLGELQRRLLIDRGPFEVRTKGVPYLSKDGYPYHLFHVVHADLAKASRKLTAAAAAEALVAAYLAGAVFCSVKKMTSMFKGFLGPEELEVALGALAASGTIDVAGAGQARIAVIRSAAPPADRAARPGARARNSRAARPA
jgi:hypothetical protein